jgi:HEPN domain-containing protein
MKTITKEWFDRAKEDLDVVSEIIERDDLTNMVAFHSQQAVEKIMKGVIEEFEIGFVKTHNLERLLDIINEKIKLNPPLEILKRLDEVYINARYPGDLGLLPSGKPSFQEAEELYNFADSFYNEVLEMFNR